MVHPATTLARALMSIALLPLCFFFFNDTATTEVYTLSLHDALPISGAQIIRRPGMPFQEPATFVSFGVGLLQPWRDRKSTRLNSSHVEISYAVFCLKKKI